MITAVLLATLVLGLISRTLPQLNVMVIGFGVNAVITFGILSFTLGAALLVFQDQAMAAVEAMFQVLKIPMHGP